VTALWVLLGAVLAVAAVVLVAWPFLREPEPVDDELERPDEELIELVEERDRALAALKELEFDHRTRKIGDADYRQTVAPLRQAAAAALRALDRYGPAMETPSPTQEPWPPPDEGTVPTPPPVEEPYPPPDEADIPQE
jgi:hypothetical protein